MPYPQPTFKGGAIAILATLQLLYSFTDLFRLQLLLLKEKIKAGTEESIIQIVAEKLEAIWGSTSESAFRRKEKERESENFPHLCWSSIESMFQIMNHQGSQSFPVGRWHRGASQKHQWELSSDVIHKICNIPKIRSSRWS
jgi:hypothetical protein